MDGLTPMMQQYFRIKEQHKDHIVFFRLGDFYEMFFEDAVEVSKELGLVLTGRDCGLAERAPMCGIPYHSCDGYIARLVKNGHKVAICEQVEDPAFAKGVVSREVIRVITPGTLMENHLLEEDANNYLCSVCYDASGYGLAFADISTGVVNLVELDRDDDTALVSELARYSPREVIFNSAFLCKTEIAKFMRERLQCTADLLDDALYEADTAAGAVLGQFGKKELGELGLQGRDRCTAATGALIAYLHETQKQGVERLITVQIQEESHYMNLDLSTRGHLELLQTMRTREKRGSLLWVLDRTRTPMGKRLIKTYLSQPLISPLEIEKRLNAVEELYSDELLCSDLSGLLAGIADMERLITRMIYGSANPKEYKTLEYTIGQLPALTARLEGVKSNNLTSILRDIDPLEDVKELICRSIADDPPAAVKDGGVIREGYHAELDELREIMHGARRFISGLEERERERSGIKSLKVKYNQVFGYFIEITRANLGQVPEDYIRKQTLANCERYFTPELKELEEKIISAQGRANAIELALFDEVRQEIARQLYRIQSTAGAIARLDVLCSFAGVSLDNRYVRPVIDISDRIHIQGGRHPVVERLLDGLPFVPNDVLLDCGENQVAVITGPNMAGKSTYMRQTALIALMAQIGCFVPAEAASIGVVDGIYTRIGASDDLTAGQSTFMVEMCEVAQILQGATSRSLVILDEIGRGTSTYDGMSIARAVIEYIADKRKLGAKTMFATHYHELTELEYCCEGVKNYNTAVKKRGDDIIFLWKITRGGADESYGIEVSKLAGIPETIVKRAHEILVDLENAQPVRMTKAQLRRARGGQEEFQVRFEDVRPSPVEEALKEIDLDTYTPIEALTTLFKLKELTAGS